MSLFNPSSFYLGQVYRALGLALVCVAVSNATLLTVNRWTLENALLAMVPALAVGVIAFFVLKEQFAKNLMQLLEDEHVKARVDSSKKGVLICEVKDGLLSDECLIWNDNMERITGYRFEEIGKVGWKNTLFSDEDDRLREISGLVSDSKTGWVFEERTISTSNRYRRSVRLSMKRLEAQGRVFLLCLAMNLDEFEALTGSINVLAREFSHLTGDELFQEVCAYLVHSLKVDFALVGSWREDLNSIDAQVVVSQNGRIDGFVYDLANTPCEKVVGRNVCCYCQNVQGEFPEDKTLVEMEIQGYVGFPLFSKTGESLGILVLLSKAPIIDEDRIISMVRLFGDRVANEMEREISNRKIEESKKWLELTMDSSRMGSWSWDSRSNSMVWSERTEILHGLEPGTFGGTFDHFIECVHPDDRDMVLESIDIAVKNNGNYKVLNRVIIPEKGIRWIQGYGRVLRDEQGELCGMAGTAIDVTEVQMAEESERRSKASLKAMIDNTLDLIMAIDSDYRITAINESLRQEFLRILGLDMKPGDNAIEMVPPELSVLWKSRYDRALKGERFALEEIYPSEEGDEFYEVSFNPIETDGTVVGVSIFSRSVTGYKRVQRELLSQKEKAEESDRLKSAFLANMSHEIRTPLNAIMGFAQLLATDAAESPEIRGKYIEIIRANGSHLLKLISDMIDIAQIETNQLSIHNAEFDLGRLMSEMYLNFEHEVKKVEGASVKLMLSKSSQNSMIVVGDETRVRQVMYNLLKNASKFTTKGTIKFGYAIRDNKEIEFFVSDTGKGIEPMHQDDIFNRFVQVDSYLVRNHEGAGLGLAICRGLVELMGGHISVKSVKGVGSRFSFTIPKIDPETKGIDELKKMRGAFKGNSSVSSDFRARILVAEDNDSNFSLLEQVLSRNSLEVVRATNGKDAVSLVEQDPNFDLVLMDVRMPEMDGYTATQKICKLRPELPVVAQSAFAMQDDRSLASDAGCRAFLPKPIDTNELLEVIQKHALKH